MADYLHSTQAGQNVTGGAQTFAGAKTFSTGIVGKTDGVAVAAGYVGQVVNVPSTITEVSQTPTLDVYIDITGATLTLTSGVWVVYYAGFVDLYNVTTSSAAQPVLGMLSVREGSTELSSISTTSSFTNITNGRIVEWLNGSVFLTANGTRNIKLSALATKWTGSGQTVTTLITGNTKFYAIRIA